MITDARPRAKDKRVAVFTLNVGNTNTGLVGWREGTTPVWLAWKTESKPPRGLTAILRANLAEGAPIVLAGVVPAYKDELASLFFKMGREVLIFRKDLRPEIEIMPRPPERVGDDRIAGALGALWLDPKRPWVIVDVGTAMTINAVTPARHGALPRFEGGLIVPGTMTSLMALSEYTAQLPDLRFRISDCGLRIGPSACKGAPAPNPKSEIRNPQCSFIGRSTRQAMLLGVYKAQIAAAVALAKGQMRELGPRTRVAFTGGGSGECGFSLEFLEAFAPGKVIPFPDLVNFGLFSAWKAWRARTTSVSRVGAGRHGRDARATLQGTHGDDKPRA